jgi:SAM-dependent methyltransferase
MTDIADLPCRSCGATELEVFLDLGHTPLADALVTSEALDQHEASFPLEVAFCPDCALVQITEEVPPEVLFVDNYLYFSSFSDYVMEHSRDHARKLIASRGLDADSLVVELASNDGYLLRNFVDAGVPVLGIDPAPDQAAAARAAGVPTLERFFGLEMAKEMRAEGTAADVIIANNVMAHVPDLGSFVSGMAHLLADDGVITVENPSVWDLIERGAFDTIYHEHFMYYSCLSIDALVRRHGLFLNHVEYFPDLHGGTNRWYLGKHDDPSDHVLGRLDAERTAGLDRPEFYRDFADRVSLLSSSLRTLVEKSVADGKTVVAYGAAAKGATLLNTVGLGTDLVSYVVDRNVHKQGRYMPGTHQLVRDPSALLEDTPDLVLILAWNFAAEIMEQQADYRDGGGAFIVPVPDPQIVH